MGPVKKNTERSRTGWPSILWMSLLVIVLAVGIKALFWGVEKMLPEQKEDPFAALTDSGGNPAPYGLRLLREDERETQEIRRWLGEAGGAGTALWLCRLDGGDYVLCLPGQDRTLTASDFTADEERGEDGEVTLVLRARTPEDGEPADPEEQLFCFAVRSETWRGIRLRIVLDGREQEVTKLVSKDGELGSPEEIYMGRF